MQPPRPEPCPAHRTLADVVAASGSADTLHAMQAHAAECAECKRIAPRLLVVARGVEAAASRSGERPIEAAESDWSFAPMAQRYEPDGVGADGRAASRAVASLSPPATTHSPPSGRRGARERHPRNRARASGARRTSPLAGSPPPGPWYPRMPRRLVRLVLAIATTLAAWLVVMPARAAAPFCDDRGASTLAPAPQLQAPEVSIDVGASASDAERCLDALGKSSARNALDEGRAPPTASSAQSFDATLPSAIPIGRASFVVLAVPASSRAVVRPGIQGRVDRPPRV